MPHPNGGQGNTFRTTKTFAQAHAHVGKNTFHFRTTKDDPVTATTSVAADGITPIIVFKGHGNVCPACWGFRKNCSNTRIGHCVESLDHIVP